MDSKTSNLSLDLSKNLDPNYDITKLLLNKINSLNKQPIRPKSRSGSIHEKSKSRSGSINEILYSPTKSFNELNFYKTTKENENIDHSEEDEQCEQNESEINVNSKLNRQRSQSANDTNQISKFLQIKQLNDLLLNNGIYNPIPINLQEQFESDSLYSSSNEPNGWTLDDRQFVLQCLNRHNYYRKLHQVPNLNLSKNLNIYSRDWVEILARNDRLEKRFSNRYGENVFVMQLDEESSSLNGAIPVDHWYYKGANYDYNSKYPKSSTNEFTQLIWKNTKALGCACARSKSGNRIYVVCSYSIAGNWPNQMSENVFPKVNFE